MKLYYYAGKNGIRNFGDELNHDVWPSLVPGIFDGDASAQFVGIGTLLNDHLPSASRTVVFGTGVGYYGPPRRDTRWDIYCVRGPLSAAALELPETAALTDPGIFAPQVFPAASGSPPRWKYAFMPHWQTSPSAWQPLCDALGFGFIDPRWEPARVLDALRRTEVLLTEAMHGAIVADALRIPWIALRTRGTINTFKWEDWCRSMEMPYAPVGLPTIWPYRPGVGSIRRARRWARLRLIRFLLHRAAHRTRPQLSRSVVFQARLAAMEERIGRFRLREGFAAGTFATTAW